MEELEILKYIYYNSKVLNIYELKELKKLIDNLEDRIKN